MTAALRGRAAREAYEHAGGDDIASGEDDDPDIGFTAEDERALAGRWAWFLDVVRPALAAGPGGMIDDDLAAVGDPGFSVAEIRSPVLLLHGERDRVVPARHGRWIAEHCPTAELRLYPRDGHITVMDHAEDALEWIAEQIGGCAP